MPQDLRHYLTPEIAYRADVSSQAAWRPGSRDERSSHGND